MAFQDLPIKRRITAVIMLTSLTALLFTTAVFMVYDSISYRQELIRNLGTTTAIFAESSSAMLAFPSDTEAQAMLATLHANKHIVAAAFYDNQNRSSYIIQRSCLRAPFQCSRKKQGHTRRKDT